MATSDHAEELQARVRQQEVVTELSQQALETDDLDGLLADVVTAVREALAADYCTLLELLPSGDEFRLREADGVREDALGTVTTDAGRDSQAGYTLLTEEPVVVDCEAESRFEPPDPLIDAGVGSGVSVLVGSLEEPWGVLGVHSTETGAFVDDDVTFVRGVANVLASAIDNVQTKRRLREERTLKERIAETSPVGIIVGDADGGMRFANERAAEITGRDADEIAEMAYGDDEWDLVDEDGDPLPLERLPFNRVLETGEPMFGAEFGVRKPDGRRVWIEENAAPIVEDGELTGVVSAFTDVTDRRRFRRQTQRVHRALETASEGISLLDENDEFVYVNQAYADTYGYDREELLGESWEILYPEDELEEVHEEILPSLEERGTWSGETIGLRSDGTQFVEDHSLATTAEGEMVCTVRDATDEKRLEEELREERALKEQILETSPVGILVVDEAGDIRFANEHAETILGRSEDVLTSMTNDDPGWAFVDADGDPLPDDRIPARRVIETGEPLFDAELGVARPDGERVWISVNGSPLRDESGDLTGAVIGLRDVTEQRRLESELESTFSRVTDAFFGLDREWNFTYVNERAAEVLDAEQQGLVGENIWEAFEPAVGTTFEAEYRRAMETQEPVSFEEYYPPLETWFEVTAYPSETGLSVYFQDVTEKREQHRQLEEQEATLRETYEIVADNERSFEEKVGDLLEIGRELIGTEYASLSNVDGEDYRFEIVRGPDLEEGTVVPLESTNCERAIATEETLVLENVADDAPDLADQAGNAEWGISCYLGAPVFVDDEVYGTFCFYDEEPRREAFSGWEVTLVDLWSRWISYELERRKREQHLEQYRALTEAANDVIVTIDTESTIQSVNPAVEDIFGYEPDELVGEPLTTLMSGELGARHREAIQRYLETGEKSLDWDYVEVPGRRADGSSVPLSITFSEIEYGGERYFTGVVRDVSERAAMERELRESEEKFRQVAENLDEVIWMSTPDREEMLYANPAYEDIWGQSRETAYEDPMAFLEGVHPDDRERVRESLPEQRHGEYDEEYRVVQPDGEVRWVHARANPIRDENGDVYRIVGITEDITERKERERAIREREQRLERYREYTDDILDAIDDVFYVVDESGQFQRWNESLTDVTGYTDEEVETMQPLEFVAEEDREALADGIAEIFEAGSARVGADVLTADGERVPYEFAASALEDPAGKRVLAGIGRDVTERERYRHQLEETIEKLEESNERLEQFAYAASHDLQEPLRMVSSYLQLIDRRYGDQLDEDGEEFLEFAVDGAERMREMIDALLTYSRVETRGDPLEPVDLNEVLEDAKKDLEVKIHESNAEITAESLPEVEGDPSQLRQVFQNLLDNAIEYGGDEPPRIHVSAERRDGTGLADRGGPAWKISVRDEGIGIDPEDADRVFEVFQRLHGLEDHAGTGIGLALCERIVERHGGDIWVDSEPGEGSTFSLTLPSVEVPNE